VHLAELSESKREAGISGQVGGWVRQRELTVSHIPEISGRLGVTYKYGIEDRSDNWNLPSRFLELSGVFPESWESTRSWIRMDRGVKSDKLHLP
jgi:hypothetical protein